MTGPVKRSSNRIPRVTLVDVAGLAKVDKAIVSRIVNNDATLKVRPDTRKRVEDAIVTLGYVPNETARHLRTSKAQTFGLLIPDFSNPVYAEVIQGAEAEAAQAGYSLMVASADRSETTGYPGLMSNDRIDGLLIAGDFESSNQLKQLEQSGIPWLFVNRHDPDSRRYVALDDARGAEIAVEHLIALGHTAIAHIAGPSAVDTAQRRRAGYVHALVNAGIEPWSQQVAVGDYTPEGGFKAASELLSVSSLPTAIFVANVSSAVGSLRAIHEAGLRVPEDISVVSLHDHVLSRYLVPSLSTVRMPLVELGARAVQLLRTSTPDEDVEVEVAEPMALIARESTAPPPVRHT
jgi:LacI family transcriptional regulator